MDSMPRADGGPIELFGSSDWRVRRRAVGQFVELQATDDDVKDLLGVLRESHRDFSRLNATIQVLAQTGADVVPWLTRLLAEPDAELRCYVALTLGERGDPRAIPAVISLLADGDVNVVVHAIEALGRLRAGAAGDALLRIVATRDFSVAFPALLALGQIGDERTAAAACELLSDPLLQAAAVEALGEVGDRAAVVPLTRLLENPAAPTAAVARALSKIHLREERRFAAGDETIDLIRRALTRDGEAAVLRDFAAASSDERSALIRLLQIVPMDGADAVLAPCLNQPELRADVAAALRIQPVSEDDPLQAALIECDADAVCVGCELLGRRGDPAAMRIVSSFLDVDEPAVVAAALDALTKVGPPHAFAAMRPLLEHPDKSIRHASAIAVATVDPSQAESEALTLVTHSSPQLRESAVKILGQVDRSRNLAKLLVACRDVDDRVARAALEQLPAIDELAVTEAVREALRSNRAALRAAAANHLAARPFADVSAELDALLDDADAWVRYIAWRAVLQHAPNSVATERLAQCARREDGVQVRVTAIAELGRRNEALDTLIELTAHTEPDVAQAAIFAVGRSTETRSLLTLANLLHDREAAIRRQAAEALAGTPRPEAIKPLHAAAYDDDPSVATAAIAALIAIATPQSISAVLETAANPRLRETCVTKLSRCDAQVLSAAAHDLHNFPVDSRRALISAICHRHASLCLQLLRIVLRDSEPIVSFAAQNAFDRLSSRLDPSALGDEGDR